MTRKPMSEAELQEIEQILPWFATSKLPRAERAAVEEALGQSPELQKQLDLIRSEMAEVVRLNEEIAPPRADALRRLMASLPSEASPRTVRQNNNQLSVMEWLSSFLAGPPRWAVAAGLIAVIAQAVVIGGLVAERPAGGYITASGGTGQMADGTLVLVRFADGASMVAVSARLAVLNVSIVEGPKAGGLFVLRIGPKDMPAAARDAKIVEMRSATDIVLFVGAVQ